MNGRVSSCLTRVLVSSLLFTPLVPRAMAQANVQGTWRTLSNTMPINPVHVALLGNGQVLVVAGSGNCPPSQSGCPSGPPYGASNGSGALLLDPVTGQTITQFSLSWDMFCNAMSLLPDGRVLIDSGTIQYDPFYGQKQVAIFDPATNSFTNVQNMAHGRWYPTLVTLGDGRVMTFSGLNETGGTNNAVEFYTVGSGWSGQYFAPWTPDLYPRLHLLSNGTVFYSGSGTTSKLFDPSTQTWNTNVATTNYSGSRTYGTSVLLPLTPANNYDPEVIIMGGGSPATRTTEIIDMGAATPKWVSGLNMSQARVEMNAVILPNGKVLALGGSLNDEDTSSLSLNADLFDLSTVDLTSSPPNLGTVSSAGANATQRLYHSVALLLPDATVWLAGGNPSRGTYNNTMEIYQPAYLFNPDGTMATRPSITSAPSSVSYGNTYSVTTPDAANISSVVLVRNGTVTHAFGMDRREVGLSFTAGSGVLTFTAPPNGNIAPPGYYMLFLLNNSGVPSQASFVQVGQQPDFNMSASPSAQTVVEGSNTSYTVNVTALGGFSGTVGLSVTSLPTGATASFNPTTVTGTGSSTLTVTTAGSTPVGLSTLTITGTAGTLSHQTATTLSVTSGGTPTVTSVGPSSGPVGGGTGVTITGTNFVSGATVTLGGAATNVVVVSATQITATTAAHAAGAVNVVVTNPDTQTGTLTNGYTYTSSVAIAFAQVAAATPVSAAQVTVTYPGPQTIGDLNVVVVGWNDTTSTVQSVTDSAGNPYSLAIGPTSGTGLRQSIYYAANIKGGSNTVNVIFSQTALYPDVRILEYQGVSAVDVTAGASGNSGTANSGSATTTMANELIFGAATVATGVTGAGSGFTTRIITSQDGDNAEDEVVTTKGSYSATAPLSPSGAWVMQMVAFAASSAPAPTVTTVSPSSGPAAGGTAVTITGTNFVTGATVTLGGTAATNVVVVSATQITATTPAHAAGAVKVVVTNQDTQAGSLTNGFTYVAAPTVGSVSPSSGPTAGGTAVSITGTNFVTGATVTLGGTAATNVVVVSAGQITATTPANAAGAVNVVVTNPDTQTGTLTNGFTYTSPTAPTVATVSPSSGPTAGGTAVSITGTNFVTGATVTLGGTATTNVVVVSAGQITATTPAHAAGAVNVVVTNPDTQVGSLTNGFTYVAAPTVRSVSPSSGPTAGGTAVSITGTNFVTGATVTLGGTAATNVVVVSAGQITATTPAHAAGAVNVVVTNPDTQSGSLN